MNKTFSEKVMEILGSSEITKADRRRVGSALKILEEVTGTMGFLEAVGVEVAKKVRVPGDGAIWIVIGTWEDGTCDIVREEGSFPDDSLVGWTPGQSEEEYWAEQERDSYEKKKKEALNAPPRTVIPLRAQKSRKKGA